MEKNTRKESKHACDGTSCSVRDGLLIIGGKWKSMIMHALGQNEFVRFNRLKTMIPGISQKMLTQQLRDLERDGLIKRKIYPEVPPRVEYSITELGFSIGQIYRSIHKWQQEHIGEIEMCRNKYDASS